MGFQDFLIDSVAHTNNNSKPVSSTISSVRAPINSSIVMPVAETSRPDPLSTIGVYNEASPEKTDTLGPVQEAPMVEVSPNISPDTTHTIPDWLKPVQKDSQSWNKDDSDSIVIKSPSPNNDPLSSSMLLEKGEDMLSERVNEG